MVIFSYELYYNKKHAKSNSANLRFKTKILCNQILVYKIKLKAYKNNSSFRVSKEELFDSLNHEYFFMLNKNLTLTIVEQSVAFDSPEPA